MPSSLPRTDARRYRERAAATRLLLSRETALERHLVRVIAGVGRRAAHAYLQAGDEGVVEALRPFKGEVKRILRPSLVATAKAFAARLTQSAKCAHAFETKDAFEVLDAEIEAFIAEHAADRVVGISDSLKTTIAGIVRRGLEEQHGEAVIARAIVEATGGEIATARARRIARTETHTASQIGQYAAAQASPLAFEKEWLASEDQRTRAAHAEANGQRVALDAPFLVGGEEMLFPGDPKASPGNTVNCRCVCLWHPIAATKTAKRL